MFVAFVCGYLKHQRRNFFYVVNVFCSNINLNMACMDLDMFLLIFCFKGDCVNT